MKDALEDVGDTFVGIAMALCIVAILMLAFGLLYEHYGWLLKSAVLFIGAAALAVVGRAGQVTRG